MWKRAVLISNNIEQDRGTGIQSGEFILVCNVTSQTPGPNQPPLIQKTLCCEHGAPTDLFWCKNITWRTRGPNQPLLVQKTLCDEHGARPFRCLEVKYNIQSQRCFQIWWQTSAINKSIFKFSFPGMNLKLKLKEILLNLKLSWWHEITRCWAFSIT